MIKLTAKITIPSTGEVFTIDQRNMISFETNLFDREDYEKVSYGIHSNSGRIEILDGNGYIYDLATQNLLTEGMPIKVYIVDSLSKKQDTLCTMWTEKWKYDTENKTVSLSFNDGLVSLQDSFASGITPSDPEPDWQRVSDSVSPHIFNSTPSEKRTQYQLTSTYWASFVRLEYNLLNNASVWSLWSKMAEIARAHIYINEYGKFEFETEENPNWRL